uniref:Transcriptional regulator, LysR family n=1 Tax=Polynucleobacter necessarius subsp. necessarius (strain STIR1) TaxID=452638 RepID=B1XU38_POLNS
MLLIVRTKGHGSKLTEFGTFLIQFIEDMQAEGI